MRILQRAMCVGIAAALALPAASTAMAQEGINTIDLLAQASGLTSRQVQMVLGNRSAYAEYPISYDFVDRKFRDAVGPDIYRNLKERGELSAQHVRNLMAIANARHGEQVASK